jgi:hypothetical protein
MSQPPHNLDLNSYTLDEIFALFDLSYDLTEENMKKAKKKVLMLHPDKSRLPSTYYLFYKKAYEVILDLYRSQNKINVKQPSQMVYTPMNTIDIPKEQVLKTDIKDFQQKFNSIYDETMAKKIDPSKYEWFKKEADDDYGSKKVNPKNMGEALETLKQKQQTLTVYRGVQEMRPTGLTSFYDDDEDDNTQTGYIECDVFSKLKFDDLRKVHRDQVVTGITESDLANVQTRKMDSYAQSREKSMGQAMSKAQSESLFEQQRKMQMEEIMRKQQRDIMLQKEYEEKQKRVAAAFLRIGN